MDHPRRPRARLYVDADLDGDSLPLAERDAHYLGRVLRLRRGDGLLVFNGRGAERFADITRLERRRAELALGAVLDPLPEPVRAISLLQALVKADAMDTIVQKATELGVAAIHLFRSEFSVVRIDGGRAGRRLEHWRRIALGACEQCGRHRPPTIALSTDLDELLDGLPAGGERIALHPGGAAWGAGTGTPESIRLLLGPEGGFSASDLERIDRSGFRHASLGPRILRADTAALAALTLAQARWGDLSV